MGTVYRRFPEKEQLIDALFEERLGEIVRAATEGLERTDPWLSVVHFLERALQLQVEDRALRELLLSTSTAWRASNAAAARSSRSSARSSPELRTPESCARTSRHRT